MHFCEMTVWNMGNSNYERKIKELQALAEYRKELRKNPQLRFLFFELTQRCNENCIHCGSRCGENEVAELPTEVYLRLLDKVASDFAGHLPMICVTGGEPLLRQDFFEIVGHAHRLGFPWGMTSNGTLITKDVARRLKEAGMNTVSVSLDGTKEYHDRFRRSQNAFERTVEGLRNLLEQGFEDVQATTVVTKQNLGSLEELFQVLYDIDVDSWRLLAIEPIGRALDIPEMQLSTKEHFALLDFIRGKREQGYPVLYGCCHWLGTDYEREVRDWYFLCNAGVYTASIMSNGDIGACLDIDRRPETIQGNILRDDFTKVWKERFEIFRTPLSERCEECRNCPDVAFCEGGSCHSWDYERDRQLVCLKRDR